MKTASPALVAFLANASENEADLSVVPVDLYTITLVNGTVIRFCSTSFPVTIGGNTFAVLSPSTPDVPTVNRFKSSSSIGLSTDTAEVVLNALPTVQINGMPMLEAIQLGFFDNAIILIERCIMPTPGDISLGKYIEFEGLAGDITDLDRTSVTIAVHAITDLLNIQMPRNLYQPGCRHSLYDAGCTLSKAAFQVTGAVVLGTGTTEFSFPTNLTQPGTIAAPTSTSGSIVGSGSSNLLPNTYYITTTYLTALGETTQSPELALVAGSNGVPMVNSPPFMSGVTGYNIYISLSPGNEQLQNSSPVAIGTNWTMPPFGIVQGVAAPQIGTNGYFSQGVLTWTSGANVGLSFVIAQYVSGGGVYLVRGMPNVANAGDAFTIVPGCDKSKNTCFYKFANLINFAGTPYIPVPETAI